MQRALRAEERRDSHENAEMQIILDPQMSEWGNPVRRTRIIHTPIHNVWRGTGELKHLSSGVKRKKHRFC